jgi:chemotaxis protein methyltransferase CheR
MNPARPAKGPKYIESGTFLRADVEIGDRARAAEVPALERLEIELFLEAVYRHHGSDFRTYALSSLRRRLQKRVEDEGLATISALQDLVLHDDAAFERLLSDLSIRVSTMFRDPSFFQVLRTEIVPMLRTYPAIRIWHAGCATGEEVYSLAIILEEEGLGDRARIYATDMNGEALDVAKRGIFPLDRMREYTANYLLAGGKRSFSDYYTAKYDSALFDPLLRRNALFAPHNLATDGPFNEFNLILCRNVLIYFNATLKERCFDLFDASLAMSGFLCLGRSESLRFTSAAEDYDELYPIGPIYQKRG